MKANRSTFDPAIENAHYALIVSLHMTVFPRKRVEGYVSRCEEKVSKVDQ